MKQGFINRKHYRPYGEKFRARQMQRKIGFKFCLCNHWTKLPVIGGVCESCRLYEERHS